MQGFVDFLAANLGTAASLGNDCLDMNYLIDQILGVGFCLPVA